MRERLLDKAEVEMRERDLDRMMVSWREDLDDFFFDDADDISTQTLHI